MELPSLLLIIVYIGILIIVLIGAIWFVYLLKMHKVAEKELTDVEQASRNMLGEAKFHLRKEIQSLDEQGRLSGLEIDRLVRQALGQYEDSFVKNINKHNQLSELLNRELQTRVGQVYEDYDKAAKKFIVDIERYFNSKNEVVTAHIDEVVENFVNKISKLSSEFEVSITDKMERELDEYKRVRMQLIDDDLRRKVKALWEQIIRESSSVEETAKLVKQGLKEFELERNGK